MFKKNRSGQNAVEYMLLTAVAAIVVLAAVGRNGFLTKAVNESLDMGVNAIDIMARCICYPDDPNYQSCLDNMPAHCPGPKGPPGQQFVPPDDTPSDPPGPGVPPPGPGGDPCLNNAIPGKLEKHSGVAACQGTCGNPGRIKQPYVYICVPPQCGGAPCPAVPAPGDDDLGPCVPSCCTACVPTREMCLNNACTCVGDCNGDGKVTQTEVNTATNILNGGQPLSACPSADSDGDGRVRANEMTIIGNNLQFGCPGTPCGNGTVDSGEQCDDGPNNGAPGDPCTLACQWVPCTGDCNSNGKIDIGDLQTSINILLNQGGQTLSNCSSADINKNGTLEIGEVQALVNASLDGSRCSGNTPCTTDPNNDVGDCDCDGQVKVNEVITLENIAQTTLPRSSCPALKAGQTVDISLLVKAVGNALHSCSYFSTCGDGRVGFCEVCDEGASPSVPNGRNGQPGHCNSSCSGMVPQCGNAIRETGEACDDGAQNGQPLKCNSTCSGITIAVCGNSVVEAGEQCDLGSGNSNTGKCNLSCQLTYCGDGVKQTPNSINLNETCDDGNQNGQPLKCNTSCSGITKAVCGNSVREAGEVCDDGSLNGQPNKCNSSCTAITAPKCGNGVPESGEQCDDGNTNNTDICLTTCKLATCGDGFVRAGSEQCDLGSSNSNSGTCNTACQKTICGDGIKQTPNGNGQTEQCEPPNVSGTVSLSGCSSACQCVPRKCGPTECGLVSNGCGGLMSCPDGKTAYARCSQMSYTMCNGNVRSIGAASAVSQCTTDSLPCGAPCTGSGVFFVCHNGQWDIDTTKGGDACMSALGDCPDTNVYVGTQCGIADGWIRIGNRIHNGATFSRNCGPICQAGDPLGSHKIEGVCNNGSFTITKDECSF
jgi:cysteine-rich repeat protein